MKSITFQRFLRTIRKRLYWWLIIHRKGIKEAIELIALAAGIIGTPVLMFLDWLFWGYGTTTREKILLVMIGIIASKKLWREDE